MEAGHLDEACVSVTTLRAAPTRCCPVCDADRPESLFDNRMASIAGIDFGYAVVVCGRCGMAYASRAPDDATMERYYRDFSKYDHPGSIDDLGAGDIHRAEVAAAFTRRLLAPGSRVLDVGCSIGLYLSRLARNGSFDVRGLDPSAASSEAARRLLGVHVEVGDAYQFDGYHAFDGVALLAVLEHLRDPRRLFGTLARGMKPGAILVVEVPNADLFGDYPGIGKLTEPLGELSNEHINFFGDAALRRLAGQVGMSCIASEAFAYLSGARGLLAAFRKDDARSASSVADHRVRDSMRRYVDASAVALLDVESRLADSGALDRAIVLYGAGSHSARLLAQGSLDSATIDVVLDRNPHLNGHTLGRLSIELPETLESRPGLPVVVSSFNAQDAIVAFLESRFTNPIVKLYGATTR